MCAESSTNKQKKKYTYDICCMSTGHHLMQIHMFKSPGRFSDSAAGGMGIDSL